MDATTMPSTPLLITQLKKAYPQFEFLPGTGYAWSPINRVVYFKENGDQDALLLHELSHALLDHTDYTRDIELLAMERAAWDTALALAPTYGAAVDEETAQTTLDSYRDWLHARSTCPACQATGLQTKKKTYTCVACRHTWDVNEARICGLKRTKHI